MKYLFTLALALPALTGWAQGLTNDGSTVTVQPGTTLYVLGSVLNNATSTLTNKGTVQLTGDLTNAGTLASSGTLLFGGVANQTFTSGAATVATLVLNNTGANGQRTLSLPANLTVGTILALQSGLVRTAPTAILTLPDGATLTGEGPGQYVQGNLRVVRAAGSGVLDFGHGFSIDRTGLGTLSVTRTAGLLTDDLSRAVSLGASKASGIDRIWTVETEIPPTAAVPVALHWLADDDNGLTTFSQLQAWRADQGTASWAAAGSPQAATTTSSTRSFSFSTAALGRLTVAGSEAPLPVALVSFTAVAQGEDALLRWTTASERNNDHFEVEASADGQVFGHIGMVAGHGTTTRPQQYQLVDKNSARYAAAPVYYRLRQVDLDGSATFSPVRAVHVGIGRFAAEAFPTPLAMGQGLNLRVFTATPGPATLLITDALGHTLAQRELALAAGSSVFALPEAASWAQGLYLVRVQQGSQQQVSKVVRE